MSHSRLLRGYCPAVTLLAAVSAFAGLAFLVPVGQNARAADTAPKATAGFQTTERLILNIAVPAAKGKTSQTLKVELVGPGDKVLADSSRKVTQDTTATSERFEFNTPKAARETVLVRTILGAKRTEVPLAHILLSKAHETSLTGSTTLFVGSQATLRCAVQGVKSMTESIPLSAGVQVRLLGPGSRTTSLFKGKTDASGIADVRFTVPEIAAGNYKLEVLTKSAFGEENLQRDIRLQTSNKILLTTDKPLYQPGQTIHLRALALRTFDLVPISKAALTLEVEDGKGNKVFKKALETSAHGIASADFVLADEVNMGTYRIRGLLADLNVEKTVEVKRYVLPKFKTTLTTEKPFYLPKETIKGTIQTDYLFGKPVAGGTVEIKASTFDIAFREFHTFKGKTDRNGHAKFEIKLPDYFVGTPLAKGNAIVRLEAKVTDTADHAETVSRTYPVSDQSIRVTLIPEGGKLVPGLENRIFAAALYPDGSPAECSVDVWLGRDGKGKPFATLKTADTGLAELKLSPRSEHFRAGGWMVRNVEMLGGTQQRWEPTNVCDLTAEARDAKGNRSRAVISLSAEPLGDNVLLRLDKAIYKGGETVKIDIRSTAGLPTVFLDVIKSGQTMLTRWLDVRAGQAGYKLDLPASVFGTLEVHAYQMLVTGEIIRDTRVVYVNPANELKIKVSADKTVYQPGAEGVIRFEVTDPAGKPAAAALGVLIVDEAVYALQEMQPGLEKVYFTLQKELLQPSAQAVYKPSEGLDTIILRRKVPADRQQVAQVLLTAVKPKPQAHWNVNPGLLRQQQAKAKAAELGVAVFKVAERSAKPVALRDRDNDKWLFAGDLLDNAIKDKSLSAAQATDPLGGRVDLNGLSRLVEGFSPERLAHKVTQVRLDRLLSNCAEMANFGKKEYFRDGKWTYPATFLTGVAKKHSLGEGDLRDAWGNPMKLLKRDKATAKPLSQACLNDYDLVSAGPDGRFGTADDLTAGLVDPQGAHSWWLEQPSAELLPTSKAIGQTWQYTFENPGKDWFKPDFNATGWKTGPGGFGTATTPGSVVRTAWKTADIWIRREFDLPKGDLGDLQLLLHHDDDAQVYLNGVVAVSVGGALADYSPHFITPAARASLKPGKNVIAIHCRNTGGDQYIDAGLIRNNTSPLAYRDGRHNPYGDPRARLFFARGGRDMDDRGMRRMGKAAMPGVPGPAGAGTGGGGGLGKMAEARKPADAREKSKSEPTQQGGAAPPARMREYFPETLLWQPALITDDSGRATLKVPFADSITTWRLSASASSRTGGLGGVSAPLRVFQDFFVDLDLPVALTQNDEVAFPVAVYNYLKVAQKVTLELKEDAWFDLVDGLGRKRTLELEPNQVTSVKFRIRARKVGHFPLTVDARGTKTSDAIRRSIDVLPDGVAVEKTYSDQLKGTVNHTISIPPTAIEGASRLLVKVYPGVQSQLLEGVDAMLRMPNGCFEQTSSSAYPNILVVDYMKRTRSGSPATLMRAEQFLNAGYQRLLTFERPGGGFDWWGSGEPLIWLSAYGLQEFNDMAKVWPIDRGIIERTQKWLMKQQAPDGTWSKIGATHSESIERMGDPKLLLTSYVTWALLDSMPKTAGWQKSEHGKQLKKAIEYIREQAPKADNAYILALAANALASWDATDDTTFDVVKKVLAKLNEKREHIPEWKVVRFPAGGQSLSYARGDSLTVETTALAVLAMLKNGQFANTVNQSLVYLVKSKDANGAWGSTQATILALKALLAGMGGAPHKGTTPFVIEVGGKEVMSGKVTESNSDVLQQFDLREHLKTGDNEVSIEVKGDTALLYQVVGRHFEPRSDKVVKPAQKPVLEVAVAYDRTKLTTADMLKAKATLRYHGKVPTYQVIVDLPIPPGFTVDGGDFAELVAAKKVMRFSVTARQVTLYVGDVKADSEHVFEYTLKPKYPIKAKAPAAVAYEYYTPANRGSSVPVALVVEDKK